MILHFGFQSHRCGQSASRATTVAVALMLASILPLALAAQRQAALGRVRAWTVPNAPPCPVVSRAAVVAFGEPIRDVFTFEGTRYGRSFGYASCARIPTDPVFGFGRMPVCQFNTPAVVEVNGPHGRLFFMTGLQAVTITVPDGRPQCVLGARLAPDWRRN
jgi:hypothetical protein